MTNPNEHLPHSLWRATLAALLAAALAGACLGRGTATPPTPAGATPTTSSAAASATLESRPTNTVAAPAATVVVPTATRPAPTATASEPPPSPTPPPDPVLIAAGDIASCVNDDDEATAQLVEVISGTVATLGDNVYERGTPEQFSGCYDPAWGRFKNRIRPSPGNHEYLTPGAAGYFDYFGAAAGQLGQGYYSYDLGAWHLVALNSVCWEVGGCGADSPQALWLAADLQAHPAACTLAYWHHPRFSSGLHGDNALVQPLWDVLYAAGAEVVLNGHDHHYERFAPQDPNGTADPARGLREFIVGTGGRSHYPFPGGPGANSEASNTDTYGVLKLTLHADSYDWEFVPVAGKTFTDSGSGTCHS